MHKLREEVTERNMEKKAILNRIATNKKIQARLRVLQEHIKNNNIEGMATTTVMEMFRPCAIQLRKGTEVMVSMVDELTEKLVADGIQGSDREELRVAVKDAMAVVDYCSNDWA